MIEPDGLIRANRLKKRFIKQRYRTHDYSRLHFSRQQIPRISLPDTILSLLAAFGLNRGVEAFASSRRRLGPVLAPISDSYHLPPVEPVSTSSNRVSATENRILKIRGWRLSPKNSQTLREGAQRAAAETKNASLTRGNVKGILIGRDPPTETGLAGWVGRIRTVKWSIRFALQFGQGSVFRNWPI
jgi:hypothetical protein